MTNEAFIVIMENRVNQIRGILDAKGKEYSGPTDRLHSFKAGSLLNRCTPTRYCLSLMTKHLISIVDMVQSDREFTNEAWNEKIGDAINYLILLEALVKETK